MKLRFFCILFFLQLLNPVIAQKALFDSLYQVAQNSTTNTDKSYNFDEACRAALRYNPDTALIVAKLGLEFAKKSGNDTIISDSYNSLGVIYKTISNYSEAVKSLKQSLYHASKVNGLRQIENANSALGLIYMEQGNYSAALEIYYKLLLSVKNRNDTVAIAQVSNNMANIYFEQGLYDKALLHYKEAYLNAVAMEHEFGQCLLLGNMGSVYYKQKKYDLALEKFEASYKLSVKLDDEEGIGICYSNFASIYFDQEKYELALEYQTKSLKVKEKLNDLHGQSLVLNELGKIYDHKGDLKKGLFYSKGALNLAISIGAKELERDANEALYKMYEALGEKEKAYIHFKNHIILRDSLINEETKNKDIRNELNFQFQKQHFTDSLEHLKKEEIANQELKNEQIKTKSQRRLTYTFIIAFLIMGVLAIFIFKEYKGKKKAHSTILQQKKEVEYQSEIILEKNKEITDSINYAKRIQTALLTSDEYWEIISPEHFVFFKPKDVVSGDFFWAFQTESNLAIWVAADCTGHGVPGAFMSMLGISFFNEIIVENEVTDPSQILNKLREKIIKALDQKGLATQQRDGMDLALCVWDKNTNKLSYSGANNSLYIIRNKKEIDIKLQSGVIQENEQDELDYKLFEVKPDKQPVGFYTGDLKPFSIKEIELLKGDTVYSFSDGYVDQFGGDKGKKFKSKAFKELLLSIQTETMKEQKEVIDDTFENWKGNNEQIDDVCVIGIRI
jgi:serine phosphatase RsbU (regulator of sigma subunit)